MATQFRAVATGVGVVALGLDYAGVRAGLKMARIKVTPALWADLQQIEAGALEAMNGTAGTGV